MIDIEKSIKAKAPKIEQLPSVVRKSIINILKKILHEKEINAFLKEHKGEGAFAFVESILDYFSFGYKVAHNELENIPSSGKVIIIANHPLGALDALSLIDMVSKIRKDIKVVANDVLSSIEPLAPILIKVDAFGGRITKESIKEINSSLNEEKVVIFFPSGEVSRLRVDGIKDGRWNKGFLNFATKNRAPVLPVYIKSKNSLLFYIVSWINKAFSALLLPNEMFKKRDKSLEFKIGKIIPYKSFSDTKIDTKTKVKLFKRHLYRVAKGKKGIFTTQKCIAHPEDRQLLRDELKECKVLGKTKDGKIIYLYEYQKESFLLREIGRLREQTFRKVEEGTGKKRDTDEFDRYYKHIILWDEEVLEIVGSYRIAESDFVFEHFGAKGFYSNTLFEFEPDFHNYLHNSIELGRSFVQPRYWGSRALDYLWQGIGAYLYRNSHIKYMFGPVSISGGMPKGAQNLIVYYYKKYYGKKDSTFIKPKDPFIISHNETEELEKIFNGVDVLGGYRLLKEHLSCYGVLVPTLYKHYTELCEEGGVYFLDFNIDRLFDNCVDGFIVVETDKIKQKKRDRYIKG